MMYDRQWLKFAKARLKRSKMTKPGERRSCPTCNMLRVKRGHNDFCTVSCETTFYNMLRVFDGMKDGDPEYPILNKQPEYPVNEQVQLRAERF